MRHLQELHIESFRGIRDVKVEGIGQVNLLVGGNNSGKTSVLEAIDVHCHPLDILRFVTVSRKRDSDSVQMPVLESLRWMFPVERTENGNKMGDIRISAKDKSGSKMVKVACKQTNIIEVNNEIEDWGEIVKESSARIEFLETEIPRLNTEIDQLISRLETEYDLEGSEHLRERIDSLKTELNRHEHDLQRNERIINIAKNLLKSSSEPVETFNIEMKIFLGDSSIGEESFSITNRASIKQGEQIASALPSQLVTPVDHRSMPLNSKAITGTVLSWAETSVLELVQLFDPEIEEVLILAPDLNIPIPYVTHKKLGRVPSSIFGDGVRRALTLAAAVVNAKDGVLLIDEIETAVHVKALDKVFKWLVNACKQYNVQLFATTHSIEAIDAILATFMAEGENIEDDDEWEQFVQNLVTYRLVPREDRILVKRFAGDSLADLRYDLGQDVR